MAWTVHWTATADQDLEVAHEQARRRGARMARRFAQSILGAVGHLETHPEIGMVASDLEPEGRYRHLVVTPHRLIYRLDEARRRILILRLWHGRRDPDDLHVHDPTP